MKRSALEITKSQELIYELRIEQVMTKEVITVTSSTLMSELKETLRLNRISGTPVLQDEQLVGIISIEDLIKAMRAAEAVGMDLEDSDWNILRDTVWEETDLTYKVYKASPTAENRKTLIENMKAMDYIDPPEGKQEAFANMMEDIFG